MGALVACMGLCLQLAQLTPWLAGRAARAADLQTRVAIELLLALDGSASMDRHEFELQLAGLAAAFRDPLVLKAVEDLKPQGVAIAVTQWGGPGEVRVMVPFTLVENERDARAFGFRAGLGSRSFYAASTAIATAITSGVELMDGNGFVGQRRVIDISGDGTDNSGLDLEAAREQALAAGITINGLAIEAEISDLTGYYRDKVATGAESFVMTAADFSDYARAIREKLLRELRPLDS